MVFESNRASIGVVDRPHRRRKLVGLVAATSSGRKLNESRAHNYEPSAWTGMRRFSWSRFVRATGEDVMKGGKDKIAKVAAKNNNNCCFGRGEANVRRIYVGMHRREAKG